MYSRFCLDSQTIIVIYVAQIDPLDEGVIECRMREGRVYMWRLTSQASSHPFFICIVPCIPGVLYGHLMNLPTVVSFCLDIIVMHVAQIDPLDEGVIECRMREGRDALSCKDSLDPYVPLFGLVSPLPT